MISSHTQLRCSSTETTLNAHILLTPAHVNFPQKSGITVLTYKKIKFLMSFPNKKRNNKKT